MKWSEEVRQVKIIGALFGLVIAYQAVRFCQGAIGAPILDQAIAYIGRPFAAAIKQQLGIQLLYVDTGSSNFYDQVPAWIQKGMYFLVGIFVWLQLGLLEQSCTRTAARIYMVGFDQYFDEVRAARAEAQRERQIYEARERRRELRRKQREATQPKSGFSVATLVAGIIIGTFFF